MSSESVSEELPLTEFDVIHRRAGERKRKLDQRYEAQTLTRQRDRRKAPSSKVPCFDDSQDDRLDDPTVCPPTPLRQAGFKRALRLRHGDAPSWRMDNHYDFVIENPKDSLLFKLDVVQRALDRYSRIVALKSTSYCLYGFSYQKHTSFLTSMPDFKPRGVCCVENPCAILHEYGRHPTHVTDAPIPQRNALPSGLIDLMIEAFVNRARGFTPSSYLLVDLFCGYRSISRRVQIKQLDKFWPTLKLYENDIVDRGQAGKFDLGAGSTFTVEDVVRAALRKCWPQTPIVGSLDEHVRRHGIAVCFHASSPCNTYSSMSSRSHRTPSTNTPRPGDAGARARHDDKMNVQLIGTLERLALTHNE